MPYFCRHWCILICLFLAIGILGAGCGTPGTAMTEEQRSRIPEGVNLIVVESSLSADSLYTMAKQSVLSSECEARSASDELRDFDSEPCRPGESYARLRIDFVVDETDNGSRLEARALTASTEGQRWQPAEYGLHSLAFEEAVLLLNDLPGTMSFESRKGAI